MQLHGRRVFAGRDRAPERLRDGADVVRRASAADAEIVDAERAGATGKVRHLKTVVQEWLQGEGEGACSIVSFERLERCGLRVRPVRHGLRGHVAAYRLTHLLDNGQ